MSKNNGNKLDTEGTAALSEFQNTKLTGRTDPGPVNKNNHVTLPTAVSKVKLVDDEYLAVEFSKSEDDGTNSTGTYENRKRPVHDDFRKALLGMRIHWALGMTYLAAGKKKSVDAFDEEDLKDYTVTGISLGKNEDETGVVITGYKTREDGKCCIANTPYQKFEGDEDAPDYGFNRFLENLQDRVKKVLDETRLYLGGKRAPKVQAELELPPTT